MKFKKIFSNLRSIILISFFSIFIIACFSNPVSIGEKALQDKVTDASNGKISVISFNKLDGVKKEFFGQEIYELKYRAVLEFNQSGWKDEGPITKNFQLFEEKPLYDGGLYEFHEKGSKMIYVGIMYLEKTEKGWNYGGEY